MPLARIPEKAADVLPAGYCRVPGHFAGFPALCVAWAVDFMGYAQDIRISVILENTALCASWEDGGNGG